MTDTPAGWHPDPSGQHEHRYWDGTRWTEHVADGGVATTDPAETGPADEVSPEATTAVTPVPGDDTDTYPTATPPAYVPPLPVATGSDGPGRTHARSLVIGGAILAVVALAVAALAVFGGDDEPTSPLADESTSTTAGNGDDGTTDETDAPTTDGDGGTDGLAEEDRDAFEDALADAYADQLGLSDEQAECLAERVSELAQDGQFDEEQAMTDVFEFLSECDISVEDLMEGVSG